MKQLKLLVLALALSVPLCFVAVSTVSAHSFRAGNNVTVSKNEVVDHTLFMAGETVDIAGEVKGDVFCAGQNVIISGTVRGDVICAGQNMNITGTIDGNVRVAGQFVTLGAAVARNVTVAGQTVTVGDSANIAGDLSGVAQTAVTKGTVERDIALAGRDQTINARVGRNVHSRVEHLTVGSNAQIGGSLTYQSTNNATVESGAQVAGQTTRQEPPREEQHVGYDWAGAIFFVVSFVVFSVVLALLLPRIFQSVSQRAIDHPGKTTLVGLLAFFVIPFLSVAMFITIVGWPLAFLLMLGWLLTVVLSGPFFAFYIGRLLFKKSNKPVLIMLVGAVIVGVLYVVPIVGILVWLVAVLMGSGMIWYELGRHSARPSLKAE